MPEALARSRHDSVFYGSKCDDRGGGSILVPGWYKRFLPTRPRDFAGLALAATIGAIVANALFFQHERHPMPFFSTTRQVAPEVVSQPAPVPSVETAPETTLASPPPRPAEGSGGSQTTTTAKSPDPIGSMLRAGAGKDQQHLVAVAQAALIKLGYTPKNGSNVGADTLAALREYEKAHGMPASTEITPRVVKQLVATVNAAPTR